MSERKYLDYTGTEHLVQEIKKLIPDSTSDLTNDSGFISDISGKVSITGDTMTGPLELKPAGSNTSATVSMSDTTNPRIIFKNGTNAQPLQLVYTDFDSYAAGVSLTMLTDQSDAWFIAPEIRANKNFNMNGAATMSYNSDDKSIEFKFL